MARSCSPRVTWTIPEQERELIEAFRRELDAGMWAAVPTEHARRAPPGRARQELRRGAARRRARDLLPARRRRRALQPLSADGRSRSGTAAVVLVVLVWELARPTAMRALARARERVAPSAASERGRRGYDPGRERRAEQRARELLRSCVVGARVGDVQRARADPASTGPVAAPRPRGRAPPTRT